MRQLAKEVAERLRWWRMRQLRNGDRRRCFECGRLASRHPGLVEGHAWQKPIG